MRARPAARPTVRASEARVLRGGPERSPAGRGVFDGAIAGALTAVAVPSVTFEAAIDTGAVEPVVEWLGGLEALIPDERG